MARHTLAPALLGALVSLLFAWLAVRSVSLEGLGAALRGADYRWLVPAAAVLLASVWLRALRWRALFPGAERAGLTPAVAFWTCVIGLAVNNLLPARAGEVARVMALHHETGIPRTQSLVATVLERAFDVVVLAGLLLVSLWLLPSGELVDRLALLALALVAVALAAALVVALARRRLRAPLVRLLRRLPVVGGERAGRTAESVARGLDGVRPRTGLAIAGWTLASWLGLALSNWLCLQAFSRTVPWHAALLVLIVTNFAMVVPATAGSLGVFEAAGRAALAAYAVGAEVALSYVLVLHALNVVPYLALGAFALGRLGLRARDLRAPALPADAAAP